jgi:hypothetical protein
MAVYTIRELRDSAPKDLQGLSDEDLLREYSRRTGERFEDNADYFGLKPKGTVGEMGRQLAGGAMVDLPKMVGQGLQYTGVAPQYGLEMQRAAEARAPEYEQDTRGDKTRGIVGQALVAGARGVAPALSVAPLAFIPGIGQAAMVGGAGLLYGTSSAQETYQKLIDQGIPEEQAIAAARRVGVLQGGGEAIGSFVGGRAIRAAGPLFGLTGKTTGGLASKLTDTAIVKPLAKAYATNLAVQPLTEVAQDVGTSLIERSYGAKEEDLEDIAKQSALGGAGLTAILGPLALGGHVSRSRRAEQLKQALYGQDTPTEIRAQATDMVINEARRQGISEKDVDSWFDSQLQLEDTRNAALARLEEERKRGERNLLVTEPDPIKDRIEQNLGLTRTSSAKDYAKTFEAAYSEPSGQRVQDPVTGLERELSVGEQFQRDTGGIDLTAPASTEVTAGTGKAAATIVRDPRAIELRDTFGVVPTPQALQLYGEIQQSGIPVDSDLLIDVWKFAGDKPMTLKRLERAQQLLDSALINARKGTPNVSVPNAPAAGITTGVGTGGTVLPGTLAPSGSTNAVRSTVGSNAGLVRAPAPSVSLLPDTGGEQSTGVISTPDTTDTIATAAPVVSAPDVSAPDVAALTAAPSGPVVSRKRVVTVTPGMGQRAATAAPTDLNEAPVTGSRQQPLRSPEDRLAIARATGNAAELEAQAQEDAGTRIDSGDLSDEQVAKLIDTRFAKSKDKVRDAGILRAYLTVLRADRVKGSAEIVAAIAARYGIKPVSVRKIGNPSELVAAGKTLGLDSDQVLNLFGVDDNTKAQYTQIGQLEAEIKNLRNEYKAAKTPEEKARIAKELSRTSEKIDRLEEEARVEQTRALSSALSDEGFKSEEGETAGFGMDTEREWSKVGEEGRAASKITAALEAEETLRATLAEFEAQGDQEAIAAINELIETERAKLEAALLEATPKEKGQVERAPKAKAGAVPLGSEVDYGDKKKLSPEAIKARDDARAKLETDRKGLQKGDTVTNPKLGTGVVQSFDGTGDATTVTVKFKSGQVKELSVKLAKLEKTNAIQEPSTTSVSVQPKAEVSQRVGGQVRRAEKPAGKSETKAPWEGVTSKTKGTVEVVNTSLLDGVDQRNKANTSTPEYAALKASIAETGIVDPITIVTTPAGKPEVFEGNHRLQIARELEIKKIPVVLHSLINRSESRPVAGIKPSSLFAKEIKTDTEQAAESWDLVVAEYPEAPKFADLTAAQQKEFVGFGPDNWTADDVKTELVKLAKVSVKSTSTTKDLTAKTVLDMSKYVYHAVRSDADLESIMRDGIKPGTNVSTTKDGQAFSGEGDTILVLPKVEAGVTSKGYQTDSVVTNAVFPVAILKDTLLTQEGTKEDTLDKLAAKYEQVDSALAKFDKTLGITAEERLKIIVSAEGKSGNREAAKLAFGDFYDRITQLSREQDKIFKEMDRAESLPDSPASPAKQYAKYGLPLYTLSIDYNEATNGNTLKVTDEFNIIDVESRIIDETIKPQVLALPAPAIQQLEKHYGVKSDTAEFLARVKADVILYATKGAEAVAGAIRSTIKAIHAGVLSVAMIFNPMQMAGNSELIIMAPKTVAQTVQVKADVPAQAKAKMSASAQQVYETLYPAIKDRLVSQDKFMVITDKQTANVFIFKPDGSLFLQKKVLVGRTVGDFYKGNTDKVQNRITPAGLFTMGLRDAKRSEGEAYTAGDYDFGKVFVLDKAIDGEYSVTLFHSVWTKETDAKQRLAALNKEGAGDSRYSFGCINVDKATFKSLTENNMAQMDGAALFIVPDKAELTGEFLTGATAQNKSGKDDLTRTTFTPKTKTTTSVVPNAKTTTVDRTQVGKEENVTTAQIRRMEREKPKQLFATDLYLGKENVAGQPEFGRELRNPVTLANGTRLDGFTSQDQSVFSGYDRNGERITVSQESINPSDIVSSRDSNRTANALKSALSTQASAIRQLERGDTVEVKAEGLKFDGLITDVESLRRSPGVDAALRHYETNGMQSVIDGVETWMIAPDTVDFDAAIMMVDGKQTVAVRSGVLVDRTKSEWAIHHELGHIADNAFGENGIHSSQPEFNLQVKDNRIIARGAVAIEIAEYATNNPDSDFATTFKYPLDRSKNSKLTSDEVRLEMFAQLWAMFNTPGGNSFLEENLPKAFAFMEITDATTKQAESSTAAQAAARTPVKERGPQAPSNRGGSGLSNPLQPNRPRFLNRPDQGLVQKNIAKLPQALQQPVRNSLAALGDFAGKGLDKLVFTSDLVNRAVAGGLTSARNFADLISASKSEAREAERTVEKIADMYALVPEQDRGIGPSSFNQFLFDSTRETKWGYGKYRDDVMGDRFDALAPETQKLVKAIFEHGSTVLSQKKKVVIDSAVSEYDAMIKSAQDMGDKEAEGKLKGEKVSTLKRFDTLFKVRDGLPYAPIKRTGSHVVIAKSAEYAAAEQRKDKVALAKLENDGDHYHVSFTDGKWDARTLQSQLQDQGFFESVDIAERDTVADELFGGASSLRELTKMRAKVEGNLQAGDKSASKLLSIVSQMYLEALAEGSARKSEMRRRGVAGELDMLQSFAQQGRADAQFMASVKYNPQVQDALQQMRNQAKTGDRARRSELLNELSKRYMQSMDYSPNPWLNKLTRMSSVYFLATSPAYYLQNLTQPWIMSVPAMAGRHDYTAASAALFKAYTELGPVMRSAKLLKQQFDFAQVPADVRNAIKTLADQGKIDIGLDSEIGEFRIEGQGAIREKFNAVDKALRLAVQKVESVNRLSTAMAAYRLEFAKTKDEAKATEYAGRILTETHGDYTSFNAPRAFNNPVGKVALQFRKFQLIQLAFHAKLIKDAFTNPAERAAALRTLGYSLAHTGVLAGAMGLPGYAALSWIIGAMFGDDDEDYNLTQEIRKAIGDEDISNMVLRGTPTLLGADISGKVGAGNMLSVLPFNNADITTRAGLFQTVGTLVGGASLGMTANMVDGLGLMLAGDWHKGIERTMPKGVGDAMKAYRMQTEGMTRRNGDVILPAEDISAMAGLLQLFGIQPVKQAVVYERQQNIRDQDQKFQSRATQIKNEYVKAVKGRDTEAAAEARAAWAKLQATRVEKGYTRQPLSILLRAPQEQAKRERDTRGGVQFNKANKRAVTEEATL